MLQFCKDIIQGADIDSGNVRVGALIFSTDVRIQFHLNAFKTKEAIFDAIDEIPYIYGSTNIADALLTAREEMFNVQNGDRPDVDDVIFLVTDGLSNVNSRQTIPEARKTHAADIHVYGIGIGLSDTRELDAIATPPASENSIAVDKFDELLDLADILFLSLCKVEPTPVVDVAPSCGLTKVDVVLILDASTSVRRDNFKKMLEFCKDIVDKADIDSGSVRIGALIYSTKVEIQFHLDEYTSSEKVKEAIGAIKYIYGSTNSASALETMHEQMFVPEKGDRPDADNIAFMITDGVSNINSRRTIPEAREARAKGIKIYAIGIGLKDTRELEGMASEPSEENTFNVQDFDELSGLVETIFGDSEACDTITIGYMGGFKKPDLPPTADAGRDVVIQLPEDFVTLSGAGSTDDKEVVIYFWELSSGIRNFKMEGENQRDLQLRDLKPGLYTFTLTVFDALGQSDVDTVQVLVEEPDLPPIADAGQDIYVQLPVDIVVLNGDGSSDDKRVVAYEWVQTSGSDQIGIFPAGPRLEVVGLIEGEFEFTLTVFDELGQRDEDTVRVFVEAADEPPIADAGENIEIQLPRDSVTLSGVRSRDDVAVVSYSWTLLSGDSSGLRLQALQNDEEVLVTGLREGAYVFRLEVADEKGQTDTDTVEVNVRAADIPPKANAGKDIVIQLPENSVTLDGSLSTDDIGIVTYEWNYESPDPATFQMDGSGSPRLELSGLDAGVYKFSLTVTDEAGLIDIDGVTVTVKAADIPPKAIAGDDRIIQLPDNKVVLDGTASFDDIAIVSYEWMVDPSETKPYTMEDGDTAQVVISNLEEGSYTFSLKVTDGAGLTDIDSVVVNVQAADIPPKAIIAGDDQTIQLPDNKVVLDGTASFDDIAIVSYEWMVDPSETKPYTMEDGDTAQVVISNLEEGSYTFSLKVTDGAGLTDIDSVVVNVQAADIPPKAIIAGDDQTIQLPDNKVVLDGTASFDDIAIVSYEWMVDPSETKPYTMEDGDTAQVVISNLEEGSYTFSLKVTDGAGLTDIDSVVVNVQAADIPPKAIIAGDDRTIQLPDNKVVLDGTASFDDIAIVRYDWFGDPSETKNYTIDSFSTDRAVIADLEEGSYTFSLEVTDGAGLTDIDSVVVNVQAADIPPKANAGPDAVIKLPYNAVTLDGSASADDIAIVSYEWTGDQFESKQYSFQGQDAPVVFVTDLEEGAYTFYLKVTDGAGLSDVDDVNVIVEAADVPPIADAGPDEVIQLPNNTVVLDGSASSDDIAIVKYEWMTDPSETKSISMQGGDTANVLLSDLEEGVYTLTLKVTDDAGLTSVDTVQVSVQAADKPPNADAGRDIIEKEPVDRIVLDGSQSSDDVGIVRYRWRQREGDRSVVTKGDRSEFLTLSNLKPGQYRFTLTVVDGAGQRDTDNVLVTIIEDEPPQANAGPDYSLPSTSKGVVLLGNKSTDDVGIVTYQWRQIAGDPSALTLTGVNRPNLGVNGLVPGGFYSFELTVTDGIGQTSADTVTVVVDEAVVEETCGLEKVDLVFVVDASTSVTEINFKKQLNFMKSIVQAADIDSGSVRVGALTYSTGTDIQFYLNTHNTKADVLAAIDKIKYTYGSTNTADGLRIMRDELFSFRNGDREDVPNTCIIITDGVSNINARDTIPQAELSRDIGIHIYAVGIGLTDTRELDEIASEPASENSFAVTGFEELKGLESKIFSAICEETTPTTTTTTTTTTTPTPTTTPPACRLSKTDVVIILDASTSVTEPNFQKMRDFVKQFISNTDVDSGSVRFGLNIYSSNVDVRWHLNSYSTIAEIEDAVDKIPYVYGSTNTADALKVMHKEMFTIANGDRPDAPDICIILTDGVSNINARRTIPDAEAARQDGIHIYAIGIGLKDTTELDAIASVPASENSFNVQSFDELRGLEQKIFSAVCPGTVPPPDYPPVANAGEDQYIQLPESRITLSGLRSTDDKEIVSYTWSLLDGPAVDIRDTNSPELQLYNMQEGTYFIELEVMDELGQKDTDEVTLYVLPEPDLPPTADAGSDIEIQIPTSTVTLNGRASFDDKRITSYAWSKVSGPGSPSISGRGSATPTVSNLAPGEYVFRVVVSDAKGQSDEDTVRVVVKPPIDRPPKADAGRNFTIQLPDDSVTLNGCSSTDDIRIQRYEWQLIFGNGSSVRARGNGTCSLSLSGLAEGPYGYRLTVYDDKGQSSSDMTYITVKRAPRTTGYDVVFVLDSSVSPDKFRWMNDYARMIIREMDIDNEEFRVGYLIYSNGAYRQFDLNAYDTKAGVFTGVDRVGYRPGSKNTAAALNYVRNRMFTSRAGDRDFAKNYVILLTGDGASRDPYEAALEACLLQEEGVGMFSVGLGEISDRSELNAYSSLPTEDYELVIEDENKMGELPGLMLYNLKRGTPRKTPCPAPPVTTTREPGVCGSTGDIVFILDSSGSVGQENFYRVLNFTYSTIEGLNVDDGSFRVAIITFSDTSRLEFNLNDYTTKKDLKEGIRQVRYTYGNTHTAHALRRARTEVFTVPGGDRPDVPNVVVIITDGQSNVDHELTIPEARALKSDGVTILTVAVGFTSETSELSGLTSPPVPDNLIYVADYAGLAKLKDKLIEPLCTKSNMCRSRPCQNGGVCVDGIRSFVCICPDDFFGDTCNKECGDPSDVVIVLDSSSTVGPYNFARLKEYAQHLVQEMNKDACDINIGFMKYSSAPMVQVYLGMHTDTETNIRALESISYSRGRANMAAAFRALRTQMFNGRGGDRPNAKNIAYFLTDGTNDINADMAEPEADLTISSGTRIIPIGINMRNRFELDNIAALQGINVIEIDDEPGLIENTDKILRPMYTGNEFCAESPCRNGATCKNEPFGYRCECPIGFTGDTCSRRCTAKGNVVFAVDTSRYVTRTEMKRVRKFLRSVVKRMRFKRKAFSVGMVQFSDWAKVTLQFGRGTSKKAVRAAISGLRVHGGEPEPAMALAKANYRIFTNNKNGRDKPEYLIMVTKSMRKELDILHEANKLKVQGTKILGVGLGLTAKEQDYMESTVSLPASESTWFANDVTDLDEVADKIVSYMCDDEDMCAANPCRNNGTCHRRGGDFYCTCAVGYAGRYCQNRCNARADVVFLLDSSGSIGLDDFRNVKQFVHNMVSDLVIGKDNTRVGLATYSSTSRLGFYLNKYFNLYDLQNAIAGIQYEYGNTNTADGLRLVREYYFNGQNGDRREIQNFLLIITDGESNVLPDQTIIEADRLKKNGVHIYAVGIGKFDPFEINSVASTPASENAYMLSDYKSLSNISSSIVKRTCRDPSVCDENPCRNGGICVPGINGAFCECRAGYRGPYCNTSCVTTKDIFFVLDSSDSVGPENFKKALQFVSKITEEFSSKYSYNRFSLLTYSTEVQIVFSLGRYSTLPIMLNAIRYTRYRPGNTNTAGALRTVQEISISALGDRRDAENIVFMIADGTGNVDEGDTIPAAEALKNSGARIMAIGVNMENFDELEDIASKPSDLFKVNSYSDLEGILEDVIKATCVNGNVIEAEDVA